MYKIEMLLRYRLIYYVIVLIFICGLMIGINSSNLLMVLSSMIGIWLIYGFTSAKWIIKSETIELWAVGYRYYKIYYGQIISIYPFQSKMGIFADFANYSENSVKIVFNDEKKGEREFIFSLSPDDREEFIDKVHEKIREQRSNNTTRF